MGRIWKGLGKGFSRFVKKPLKDLERIKGGRSWTDLGTDFEDLERIGGFVNGFRQDLHRIWEGILGIWNGFGEGGFGNNLGIDFEALERI